MGEVRTSMLAQRYRDEDLLALQSSQRPTCCVKVHQYMALVLVDQGKRLRAWDAPALFQRQLYKPDTYALATVCWCLTSPAELGQAQHHTATLETCLAQQRNPGAGAVAIGHSPRVASSPVPADRYARQAADPAPIHRAGTRRKLMSTSEVRPGQHSPYLMQYC